MIRILAKTNPSQAVQGGITKRTELDANGSAGGIIESHEEISERSEHAHQVHGHEFLDRIHMLDERFDDGDELGDKAKHVHTGGCGWAAPAPESLKRSPTSPGRGRHRWR
jgi:hypothetical protein